MCRWLSLSRCKLRISAAPKKRKLWEGANSQMLDLQQDLGSKLHILSTSWRHCIFEHLKDLNTCVRRQIGNMYCIVKCNVRLSQHNPTHSKAQWADSLSVDIQYNNVPLTCVVILTVLYALSHLLCKVLKNVCRQPSSLSHMSFARDQLNHLRVIKSMFIQIIYASRPVIA